MIGSTEALARHVGHASSNWPDDARKAAERAFVDAVACIAAGRAQPSALVVANTTALWVADGKATDLVLNRKRPAPWAALVNATAAHALDYDDVLETAAAHAGAVFVPALLALGEERDATGAQLVDALNIAFDVMNALAAAMNYAHYARGWHTTLSLGAPAAAAGCARLIGLDQARARMAISAATSFASGSKCHHGTMMKPTHSGLAAQAGVLAACFAEQGLQAADEIFDGAWGFGDLFGAEGMPGFAELHRALAGPPALSSPGPWIKVYPCCASAHRPMDAMLNLRKTHNLKADDIYDAEAFVSEIVAGNLRYAVPRNVSEARFSMNHCLAVTACRDSVKLSDFDEAAIADPAISAFRRKVRMTLDPALPATIVPGSGEERCRLVLTLADNRQVEQTVIYPIGHPQAPISDDVLALKFENCASGIASSASSAAMRSLFTLSEQPSVTNIMSHLTTTTY
jgi:2-methylcitrate dehydratase PrpD